MEDNGQTVEVESASQEQVSMADSVRDTLREITSRLETTTETETPASEPPAEDNTSEPEVKEEPKEPVEAPTPAIEDNSTATLSAPEDWSKSLQEKFSKLDPETKKEFLEREEVHKRNIDNYRQAATFGAEVHKALTPYAATLNSLSQQGISPVAAIDRLLAADNVLRNGNQAQKRESIAKLAQSYNVDLSDGLPQIDPQTAAYQNEIARRDQYIVNLNQQQAQREQQEINNIINAARKGKEYFEEVRPYMATALQSGVARSIDEAYEQAVWARPDLRQKMLEKQQAEIRKQQQESVKQAKKASAANLPVRGAYPAAAPVKSMAEFVRDQYRSLNGQL